MDISKKLLDEVYEELVEEFKLPTNFRRTKTLDEIETMISRFGQEFERRAIEKSIEEQRKKREVKKTAKNAAAK
jgi:hypothetical protein